MAPRLSKTTPRAVEKKRAPRARKPTTPKTITTTAEEVTHDSAGSVTVNGGPLLGQQLPATPATTNGVHTNGATPATTNGVHTNGHTPSSPENIEHVAAAVLDASRTGDPRDAHTLAKQLPSGAAGDVVAWCLPETWRDASASALLAKLGDEDAALILAWLTCQWWEGYGVGHLHGMTSEDLRK
jgi:hypothetical protein